LEKDITRKKKLAIHALLLLVIVVSGFYIRVINLGATDIAVDESFGILAAKAVFETGKPILPMEVKNYERALWYTQLVVLSFKLLGVNEFSARFPSVIFGLLSIILTFFIGRRFFGTTVGLIASFLLAFAPFEVEWSRICRFYMMFQFFFMFGFFAFYNGLESEKHGTEEYESKSNTTSSRAYGHFWLRINSFISRWNINWWWLLLSLISLYVSFKVHQLTLLFFGSLLAYLFLMCVFIWIKHGFQETIRSKYFWFLSALAMAGVIGLAIPGVFGLLRALYEFRPSGYGEQVLSVLPALKYSLFLGSASLFPLGALFILGCIQICTRADKAGFYALIFTIVPLLVLSLFGSTAGERYLLNVFPLIILIASYSIYTLFKSESRVLNENIFKGNKSRHEFSTMSMLFFVGLLVAFPSWGYYTYKVIKGDGQLIGGLHRPKRLKEACNYLKSHSMDGDVVVATLLNPMLYYCGRVDYFISKSHLTKLIDENEDQFDQIGNLGKVKVIGDLGSLKNVLSNSKRGWIVVDSIRLNQPHRVPEDIKKFIVQNPKLVLHKVETEDNIFVFSWGMNSGE